MSEQSFKESIIAITTTKVEEQEAAILQDLPPTEDAHFEEILRDREHRNEIEKSHRENVLSALGELAIDKRPLTVGIHETDDGGSMGFFYDHYEYTLTWYNDVASITYIHTTQSDGRQLRRYRVSTLIHPDIAAPLEFKTDSSNASSLPSGEYVAKNGRIAQWSSLEEPVKMFRQNREIRKLVVECQDLLDQPSVIDYGPRSYLRREIEQTIPSNGSIILTEEFSQDRNQPASYCLYLRDNKVRLFSLGIDEYSPDINARWLRGDTFEDRVKAVSLLLSYLKPEKTGEDNEEVIEYWI